MGQGNALNFDSLKVLQSGVISTPAQASPAINTHYSLTAIVTHNLGFAPMYLAFADMPMIDWYGTQLYNQLIPLPQGIQENSTTTSNGNFYFMGALMDEDTLTFYNNAYTHSSATDIPAIPIRYVIYDTEATTA
jgi:hypothetical protein